MRIQGNPHVDVLVVYTNKLVLLNMIIVSVELVARWFYLRLMWFYVWPGWPHIAVADVERLVLVVL